MTDNSGKPSGDKFFINWDNRLAMMKTLLEIGHPFPDQDSYHDSIWNIWIERIENGQTREENQIQESYKSWKEQEGQYNDPSFDPDEWASDDYWQACQLTNFMYGALIVSIWSNMEIFLNSVYFICSEADGHNEENIKKEYEFEKIKAELKKLSINIMKCDAANTGDAVRILSNAYKHDDGQYRPDKNKRCGKINKNILSKWDFLKEQNEIDYSKLPIQEIILDCNRFCADLLQETEKALRKKK